MNFIKNDIKLIIIFVIIGFLIGPKIFASQKNKVEASSSNKEESSVELAKDTPNPFDTVKITGNSAYVFDISNQKALYSKDSESKKPLASITKIMTAIVALESSKEEAMVEVKGDDLDTEGNTGLSLNEKWSLKNLLALTLVTSSNDGASAIAASVGASLDKKDLTREEHRNVFISRMNDRAKELELNSFYFTTPTGLDIGNTPGGVGSAHDVAKLFEYTLRRHSSLLQYTALPEISVSSKQNIIHRVINTNEIASVTSGIIGGKTGFTDLAGGNLAMVVDIGIQHPVVIVVLGSTREKRFTDVEKLLDATKIYLNN